jgi:hypothetical protein
MGLTNLIHKPNEHTKYAIDKFWFILQNVNKWYLITPPSVIQKEDYSDIEKKITNYGKLMIDLDKESMFNAIKEMKNKEQNKNIIKNNLKSVIGLK